MMRHTAGPTILLVTLLLAAGCGGDESTTTTTTAAPTTTTTVLLVEVPDLVGQTVDYAEGVLSVIGLVLVVDAYQDSDGEQGVIFEQLPVAGSEVTPSTPVVVKVPAPAVTTTVATTTTVAPTTTPTTTTVAPTTTPTTTTTTTTQALTTTTTTQALTTTTTTQAPTTTTMAPTTTTTTQAPTTTTMAPTTTIAVTRPGPITEISAVGGDRQVTLSWTMPDDGGSPLTGIIIQMAAPYAWAWFPYPCPSSADASSVELFDGFYWLFPLGSATSITLANCANIQAGGTYEFRVMAVNAIGPAGFWGFSGPAVRVATD